MTADDGAGLLWGGPSYTGFSSFVDNPNGILHHCELMCVTPASLLGFCERVVSHADAPLSCFSRKLFFCFRIDVFCFLSKKI